MSEGHTGPAGDRARDAPPETAWPQRTCDGCPSPSAMTVPATAKGSAGETVFAENCAVCHAEDGAGQAALGAPALNNQIWLYKGTKDAIVAQITKPKHGSMPAWSERLDPSTIKMLAVYVHNLGGGK